MKEQDVPGAAACAVARDAFTAITGCSPAHTGARLLADLVFPRKDPHSGNGTAGYQEDCGPAAPRVDAATSRLHTQNP